jgi:hypothetical protein
MVRGKEMRGRAETKEVVVKRWSSNNKQKSWCKAQEMKKKRREERRTGCSQEGIRSKKYNVPYFVFCIKTLFLAVLWS